MLHPALFIQSRWGDAVQRALAVGHCVAVSFITACQPMEFVSMGRADEQIIAAGAGSDAGQRNRARDQNAARQSK